MGERFDAASEADGRRPGDAPAGSQPFLGIQFACCRTYARVYRTADAAAYEGRCPRCGKRVVVPIGPGGTGQRFFSTGG